MYQLLGWTLGVVTGAVGLATIAGNVTAVISGLLVIGILVLQLIRHKDERQKL